MRADRVGDVARRKGGRRDSSAMAANSAADAVDVARLRAEPRRVLANRVGDEARREVAVVALDHSGYAGRAL